MTNAVAGPCVRSSPVNGSWEVLSHQPNRLFPPPLLCEFCCATEIRNLGLGGLEDSYRILWEGTAATTPTHRGDNIQPMGLGWCPLVSVVSEALLFSFFWSSLKKTLTRAGLHTGPCSSGKSFESGFHLRVYLIYPVSRSLCTSMFSWHWYDTLTNC